MDILICALSMCQWSNFIRTTLPCRFSGIVIQENIVFAGQPEPSVLICRAGKCYRKAPILIRGFNSYCKNFQVHSLKLGHAQIHLPIGPKKNVLEQGRNTGRPRYLRYLCIHHLAVSQRVSMIYTQRHKSYKTFVRYVYRSNLLVTKRTSFLLETTRSLRCQNLGTCTNPRQISRLLFEARYTQTKVAIELTWGYAGR